MVYRLFASIPSLDASYYDVKYTENDSYLKREKSLKVTPK